jgi:hypothetical protein
MTPTKNSATTIRRRRVEPLVPCMSIAANRRTFTVQTLPPAGAWRSLPFPPDSHEAPTLRSCDGRNPELLAKCSCSERWGHHAWHRRGTDANYRGRVFLRLTSDHDNRRYAGEERSLLGATTGPMPAARDRRALRAQPVRRTERRSDPSEAYGIELALLLRSTDLSKARHHLHRKEGHGQVALSSSS